MPDDAEEEREETEGKARGSGGGTLVRGAVVTARVDLASTPSRRPSLPVVVADGGLGKARGFVDVTHMEDVERWSDDPLSRVKDGSFVRCRVVSRRSRGVVELTMRPSLMSLDLAAFERALKEEEETLPSPGDTRAAYVASTNAKGCFLRLDRARDARVMLKNLSDAFVRDVEAEFPSGRLVAGVVVGVDRETGRVDMTMRKTLVTPASNAWESLGVGEKLDGVVKNVVEFGVFVTLANGVVGLCHVSELADAGETRPTYSAGDRVRCVVRSVDLERKRLSLGLKPSYFAGDEIVEVVPDPLPSSAVPRAAPKDDVGDLTLDDALSRVARLRSSEASSLKRPRVPSLSASDAGGGPNEVAEIVEAESGAARERRLSRRQRKARVVEAEAKISAEEDRLARNAPPATAEEWERLMVSNPNSSLRWIQFMAFFLDAREVDRARAVGERALRTISYREEEEKTNVWKAMLALETSYGDERSRAALFARMLAHTDRRWAYLALAEACSEPKTPENFAKVEAALKSARKHSETPGDLRDAWLAHIAAKFDWADAPGGRKLLKDALKSLPRGEHLSALLAFCRLEFSHPSGDPERARTVAEGVLETYPKRTDVWNVYVDLEAKFGVPEKARALFERLVEVKTSVKNVKTAFKKWLAFEQRAQGGDDDRIAHVKELARAFVDRLVEGPEAA